MERSPRRDSRGRGVLVKAKISAAPSHLLPALAGIRIIKPKLYYIVTGKYGRGYGVRVRKDVVVAEVIKTMNISTLKST